MITKITTSHLSILLVLITAVLAVSCTGREQDTQENGPIDGAGRFNLWVQLGESPEYLRLIKTFATLEEGKLSVDDSGADITAKLPYGLIQKGGFYYTVSRDGKFGKYRVANGKLSIIRETPFTTFYNNFSHVWKNDSTLLLFGPDETQRNVIYAVINVNTLNIDQGILDMPPIPEGYDQIKPVSAQSNAEHLFLGYNFLNSQTHEFCPAMRIAVLHRETLASEKQITDTRTGIFGRIGIYGHAKVFSHIGYQDLYQPRSFVDEKGDIYFLTSAKSEGEANMILRIKNGTDEIDSSYVGYSNPNDEPYGLWYLGNGRAIVQIGNIALFQSGQPHYIEYRMLDLASGDLTKLDIPADDAGYTNNVVVDEENGKAYIVSNADGNEDRYVWVYHITEGTLERGMAIASGYTYLLRLDLMQ